MNILRIVKYVVEIYNLGNIAIRLRFFPLLSNLIKGFNSSEKKKT